MGVSASLRNKHALLPSPFAMRVVTLAFNVFLLFVSVDLTIFPGRKFLLIDCLFFTLSRCLFPCIIDNDSEGEIVNECAPSPL